MSYFNLTSLTKWLKCGNRISEGFRGKKVNVLCISGYHRVYSLSCGSKNFENRTMKTEILLKRKYNTLIAQGQNSGTYIEHSDSQLFATRRVNLLKISRHMAGHSKWQNIKHIKAAKDQAKSKLFQKYSIAIKKAVLDGGPNPKGNSKLAQLLEEAKQCNMPNASIERSIKRAKETRCQTAMVEVQGPGGYFLVVEMETDNVPRSVHDVKLICRKIGAAILPEGRTRPIFDQKGIIIVNGTKDNSPLDCGKAMDVAIEAEAEDVQEEENDNEEKVLKFICDPSDFHKVKKYIESSNYIVDDAAVKYIAKDSAKVVLSDELMDSAGNFCDLLEQLPEVLNIYDNIN